jgi:hypothetical protein
MVQASTRRIGRLKIFMIYHIFNNQGSPRKFQCLPRNMVRAGAYTEKAFKVVGLIMQLGYQRHPRSAACSCRTPLARYNCPFHIAAKSYLFMSTGYVSLLFENFKSVSGLSTVNGRIASLQALPYAHHMQLDYCSHWLLSSQLVTVCLSNLHSV